MILIIILLSKKKINKLLKKNKDKNEEIGRNLEENIRNFEKIEKIE